MSAVTKWRQQYTSEILTVRSEDITLTHSISPQEDGSSEDTVSHYITLNSQIQ